MFDFTLHVELCELRLDLACFFCNKDSFFQSQKKTIHSVQNEPILYRLLWKHQFYVIIGHLGSINVTSTQETESNGVDGIYGSVNK